jgi:hypothetical protein
VKHSARLLCCVAAIAAIAPLASCARSRHSSKIDALMASVPDKERKQALAKVAELYEKASFHLGSLEELAGIIALSDRNLDALLRAADLVAGVGFNTVTIIEVAAEAGKAKLELPEFRDLVELAVLRAGGHDELIAEAGRAALAESADEVASIRRSVAEMRERADWKTVEEAVAMTREQQRDIERTIRERLRRTR